MASAAKKVFDVAKPGNSPADATARPLIVGHKSEVADATITQPGAASPGKMITIKSSDASETADETSVEVVQQPISTTSHKTIQPLSHEDTKADTAVAAEAEAPVADEAGAEPESEDVEPDEPAESSDGAVLDAVAGQAGGSRKSIEEAEAAAKKEAAEKLIASKQYFLPIDESKSVHRFERFMIGLLLVLLLGLIAFDLAIDAGLIKTDIKPFVDLIKN